MPAEPPQTRDVFISYSTKDKHWADMACAVLEQHRLRCWVAPRDITPGTEWGAAIIAGLDSCRMMVLIFSASANDSPQVRREVERAISKGLTVLPLRVEDVLPAGSLEYALGNTHWLDAFTPPVERQMNRLAESVQTILGRGAGAITPVPPPPPPPRPRVRIAVAVAVLLAAVGGVIYATRDRAGSTAPNSSPEVAKHGREGEFKPGSEADPLPTAPMPREAGAKQRPDPTPGSTQPPGGDDPDDEPVIRVGSRVKVKTATQAFANAFGEGGRFMAAGREGVVDGIDEERDLVCVLLDDPAGDKVWILRSVLAVVPGKK